MTRTSKTILVLVLIALLPTIVKLQAMIDPERKQFQPGAGISSVITEVGNNPVVLPSQYIAGTVIGMKEVVAGLLWVRVNDFFHSGNYEAIVPLNRMITWLDPHQIDVYGTGAWHLAYNFVDSNQRADRRYLMPAIKFLEEGVQNNPGVWDPEFDLGFVLYSMKAHDYEKALYWIKRAANEKDAPPRIHRQVAHAYEKAGMIDECIEQWRQCVRDAEEQMKKDPKDSRAKLNYQIAKQNLEMRLIRRVERAKLAENPQDVKFEATLRKLSPRVFVVSGKANLPDFSRIGVTLMDADYEKPDLETFDWTVDPDVTALVDIGIHGIVVEDGKFERKFDVTKDVKQYPFKKDEYVLTLTFDPRTGAPFIQDIVGWTGEGITDETYLDTTSSPGIRKITKVIHLKRKDVI